MFTIMFRRVSGANLGTESPTAEASTPKEGLDLDAFGFWVLGLGSGVRV